MTKKELKRINEYHKGKIDLPSERAKINKIVTKLMIFGIIVFMIEIVIYAYTLRV